MGLAERTECFPQGHREHEKNLASPKKEILEHNVFLLACCGYSFPSVGARHPQFLCQKSDRTSFFSTCR